MVMAAKTGEALGLTPIGTGERLKRIIQAYQLPTEINVEYKELVHHMSMDKKNDHGGHKLILLKAMGKSMIYTVAEAELSTILEDILELAL
jgi:3-dehydroquinate synthase